LPSIITATWRGVLLKSICSKALFIEVRRYGKQVL